MSKGIYSKLFDISDILIVGKDLQLAQRKCKFLDTTHYIKEEWVDVVKIEKLLKELYDINYENGEWINPEWAEAIKNEDIFL